MAVAKPRLAIIGCGAVVETHLLPALRRAGWNPSVLIDPSEERRNVLEKRAGKGTLVKATAWEDVADRFDAALVAAPHAFHGALGLGLAQAGKHIFMEKPLATTKEEAIATIAAAERMGVTLSVGLLRRYLQVTRWTKALLESRTLGDIRSFEAREGFVFNWATASDALLRRNLSAGGVLIDTGAHTLDLLSWWFGPMEPTAYRDDADGGVEADCTLEVDIASGGTGRIELSRLRNLRNTVRIEGSAGFVEVHVAKNEVLAGSPNALAFSHDGVSPAGFEQQLFPSLFDGEIRNFLKSATSGEQAGIGGREGVASVALIQAAYAIRTPLAYPWQEAKTQEEPLPSLEAGSLAVVTGASGFIGGRLVERLVEAGVKVRCPVRSIGQATRLARLPVEIVRLNLADRAAVERVIDGADYVFHCAYDPRSRLQNVEGTKNLIEASAFRKVKRFVYVSTFSVYEPFPDGPLSERTQDGNRGWEYVRTKLDLEREVLDAYRQKGLAGTIVQPAIVYGPFSKPWTNAPAEMLIYGDVVLPDRGDGICNTVHVDDVVDGMICAAIQPGAVGERFILAGPDSITWGTFFETFANRLRTSGPIYWPEARISAENHGLMRDIRMVLSNPKRIIQIAVRSPAVRQALQSGLDALPGPLRRLVDTYYFGSGGPRVGGTILPDPRTLALYRARPVADSSLAERRIGYRPRHTFASGMVSTAAYLDWAYGDVRSAIVRRSSSDTAEPFSEEPSIANAR